MATTKKYVSLEKLGLYDEKIKKVISDGDAATLASAKSYADGLAVNYDAAGSASTAEANAKAYADGKDAAIAEAKKAGTDAQAAAEAADAKAVAAQTAADNAQAEVDALELLVGTLPEGTTAKDVVDYVNIKTSGIATDAALEELQNQLNGVQGEVTTIKGDYLKASDKEELAGDIDDVQSAVDTLGQTHATDKAALEAAIALKADQTALEAVSAVANAAATKTALEEEVNRAKGEEARIEGLVTAEAAKAREEEGKLDARLVEVETFFKTADGETLDTALDTLVEIQKYITDEGSAADQMVLDIAANKKAIEDHMATDHDFAAADEAVKEELNAEIAKKADKTTVEGIDGRLTTAEGKITTVEGKVTTLEGEMDAVEAAVATKAEAQALTDAVAALEGVDAGQEARIKALEDKFGGADGSVEDQIADAKQEAIDAAAQDATTKANTAESNAKTYADGLNTAMDTRVDALEADTHTHANKAELDKFVDGDKAKLDDAASKAHVHNNLSLLESITGALVTSWSNAEQNAKTYADGLNTTMSGRMDAVEAWQTNMIECSEEDINALFA